MKHTCIKYAGYGVALGVAAVGWVVSWNVAFAQGADAAAPMPDDLGLLLQLLMSGGLPAALGLLGWKLGRLGPVVLTIKVVPDGALTIKVIEDSTPGT